MSVPTLNVGPFYRGWIVSSRSAAKSPVSINADEAFARGQAAFYGTRRRRPSFREAFPLLLVAAKAGIPHAQNLVGFCLDEGKGVDRDQRTARHWYAKAARAGHVIATVNLAMSYESGAGGRRSPKRAVELYRIAAKAGDAWAQCNLGVRYLDGDGVKANHRAGLRWMKAAAMQGEPKAQYNLGRAYFEAGGKANATRASEWLEKAARQGHGRASRLLRRIARLSSVNRDRSAAV